VRSQTTELNQSLPQAQILGFRSKFHGWVILTDIHGMIPLQNSKRPK
jgi:hypothetical protein